MIEGDRRASFRARRSVTVLVALLVLGLASLTGCATDNAGATRSSAPPSTRRILPIDFSKPGPYKVGVAEVNITPTAGSGSASPDNTGSVGSGSSSTTASTEPPTTSTTSTTTAAPGSADGTTSTTTGPASGGTATRSAAVFYPADAGYPGQYPRVDQYTTAEAFPEQVRANLPSEIVQTVKVELLKEPPANREGPFPVVIHSHDAGSYYLFESRHFEHLASWGFVVAAPDHKERSLASLLVPTGEAPPPYADQDVTDMRNTLQALRTQNLAPSSKLHGALNFDQLAAEGHGAGGRAAALFAKEPTVKAFIGLAPSPSLDAPDLPLTGTPDEELATVKQKLTDQTPPQVPSMLIASDQDNAVPLPIVRAEYEWLGTKAPAADQAQPKTLAVLKNAGHQAYTDLCAPIRARGGLSQYADRFPPLADFFTNGENGCLPENLDPDRGYALINQLTVAQLRWVFRFDDNRASLDPAFLTKTFGDALESIDHAAPGA